MKNLFTLFLLLLFVSVSSAQSVTQALENYFEEPQEIIHLSLNKTSFIPGEHIWFQGYVVNPKTKFLSSLRQNIKVSIYSADGVSLRESFHLVNGGSFKGDIDLTDFPSGKYQVQAETSFLNQFDNPYLHTQVVYILGDEDVYQTTKSSKRMVHWLPESGNLIHDIASNLGIKVTDNQGNAIAYKAKLMADNTVMANFTSNEFGLAKVRIQPDKNTTYRVEFSTREGVFSEEIPADLIKNQGFIIQHQSIDSESRAIRLVAKLDNEIKTEDHVLLLHQNGKYGEIPIKLNEDGEYSFILRNKNIFEGVNTLTYIFQGKPVAERLIFNRPKKINSENIEIGKSFSLNKDSMSIKFTLNDLNKKFTKINISVLDAENKVNTRTKNISSSFYLEPYVKGFIENPAYYFVNPTTETDANLDLLLLTQGWSRYDWDAIFNFNKNDLKPKENGVATRIEVDANLGKRWDKLIMYASTYADEMVFKLDKDNPTIELEKFYPIEGDSLTFSLVSKKGQFKSPKNVTLTHELSNFDSKGLVKDYTKFDPYLLKQNQSILTEDDLAPLEEEGVELLNEVKLSAKNSSEDYFVSHKEDYQFGYNGVRLDVDEDAANLYITVGDYLSAKGWFVQALEGSLRNNRGGLVPLVIINNSRQSVAADIINRRLDEFEYVIFDKTGYGMGVEAQGGVIRLRLRETEIFTNPTESGPNYLTIVNNNGFAYPKEYFNPSYEMLDFQTYKDVASIAWFTDMFSEDNSFTIQHLHTDADAYEYYIEGVSEDGLLINEKMVVKSKL